MARSFIRGEWRFADLTERDNTGTDHGLRAGHLAYVATPGKFYVCVNPSATTSTWAELGGANRYHMDFTAHSNLTISDGANVLDDGTSWTAANTAATDAFEIVNGTGLQIDHDNTSTDYGPEAGTRTCPLLAIRVTDLLPNWFLGRPVRAWIKVADYSTVNANFEGVFVSFEKTSTPAGKGNAFRSFCLARGYNSGAGNEGNLIRFPSSFTWLGAAGSFPDDLWLGVKLFSEVSASFATSEAGSPTLTDVEAKILCTRHESTNTTQTAQPWETPDIYLVIGAFTNNTSDALDVVIEHVVLYHD